MSQHRKSSRQAPARFSGSSYYASARRTGNTLTPPRRDAHRIQRRTIGILLIAVVLAGFFAFTSGSKPKPAVAAKTATQPAKSAAVPANVETKKQAAVQPVAQENHCSNNTLDHFIVVSVLARHLWACEGAVQKYDSPVITGMEQHAATLTPQGTYKIYGKVKDTVLTGSDETGSWKDPVSYWMPWLDNEYGTYGFHDATWRDNSEFGTVDPNSDKASHGCVELPLATAAWIYNWASVGTTLTVKA